MSTHTITQRERQIVHEAVEDLQDTMYLAPDERDMYILLCREATFLGVEMNRHQRQALAWLAATHTM